MSQKPSSGLMVVKSDSLEMAVRKAMMSGASSGTADLISMSNLSLDMARTKRELCARN